jgi:UDP-N-acetylmuramoylalanine--D-glutamate ligase
MQLRGKRISILGAGRSGLAVARFVRKRRAQAFLSEAAPAEKFGELSKQLTELDVQYEFGENTHRVLESDLIVISPGVPLESPIVQLARSKEIKIISEIELAYQYCDAPIIAITGTNGKTTTTTLMGEIMRHAGWNTYVAGNIGVPFCDVADEAKGENSLVVLEVSSFQLDTIDEFRPKVSMILNITPDHLDRYPNYEAYIQSKFRIAENQKGQDIFVYNHDDEVVRSFADTLSVKTWGFSIKEQLKQGAFLDGDQMVVKIGREKEMLIDKNAIGIPGPHNLMNSMAAALAAKALQVESAKTAEVLRDFQGVEHRIEFVRELDGVKYYNDSKATNVDSLYYALGSFRQPIVLIAGGKDKGNDYKQVLQLVKENVKAVVAVGQGADKLKDYFSDVKPVLSAGFSMEEAIKLARETAKPGDIVLLSPACASFDMFNNYEHRGEVFKELVKGLK